MAAALDRDSLVLGDELGKGGQGRVFAVTAPDFGRPVAYKEYKTAVAVDRTVLGRMVDALAAMPLPGQAEWLNRFAWPLALVDDGPGASGFIMPRVPDRFYTDWERNGTRTRRIAEFQHLLNAPEFVAQRGIVLDRRQQYELLADVAESLDRLHANGIAVGDLSPKNLLFDVSGPTAAVFVLDCDAMAHTDDDRSQQVETPGWGVPVNGDGRELLATPASDAYKFGLLALRLLAGSQDATSVRALPDDADTVRPLLQRALSADPRQRPTPGSWIPTLRVAASRAEVVRVHASGPERLTATAPATGEKPVQNLEVLSPENHSLDTHSNSVPSSAAPPARPWSRFRKRHRQSTEVAVPPLPSELRARLGSGPARSAHVAELKRQVKRAQSRASTMNIIATLLRFLTWIAAGLAVTIAASLGYAHFQKWRHPTSEYLGQTHAQLASNWLTALAFTILACLLGFAAYRVRHTDVVTDRIPALTLDAIIKIYQIVDAYLTVDSASDNDEVTAYLVISDRDWRRSLCADVLRLVWDDPDVKITEDRIHFYSTDGAPIP